MNQRIIGVNRPIVAAAGILAACLMATLLFKTPHSLLAYILFPTPFLFLITLWFSFTRVAKIPGLDAPVLEQGKASSFTVKEGICSLAVAGFLGMAIAFAIGWQLGHISIH